MFNDILLSRRLAHLRLIIDKQLYERNDFWPKEGSALIGHADDNLVPEQDFNHAAREAPHDIGAYESEGRTQNPGWKVQAGFKRLD